MPSADIEHLRAQPELFGAVPSHWRLYRTFRDVDADTLDELRDAFAPVRVGAWRRMATTTGTDMIVLDIDCSLHEVHSENKAEMAPHYKGGFGFHPIYCFADATGGSQTCRYGLYSCDPDALARSLVNYLERREAWPRRARIGPGTPGQGFDICFQASALALIVPSRRTGGLPTGQASHHGSERPVVGRSCARAGKPVRPGSEAKLS